MSGRNKTFSENVEINSLAMAHSNMKIKPFKITKWLKEGDIIYLDDKNPTKQYSLEVIDTPGHTPDSIALYAYFDDRLFFGDTLYPFTAVHLDCIGSSFKDFLETLQKVKSMLSSVQKLKVEFKPDNIAKETIQNEPQQKEDVLTNQQKQSIDEFISLIDLDKKNLNFDVKSLLELNDWNVSSAANMYLSNPMDIQSMCPPKKIEEPKTQTSDILNQNIVAHSHVGTVISCGHVEANWPHTNIDSAIDLMEIIKCGAIQPSDPFDDYSEYSENNITIIIQKKQIENLN